MLVELPVWVLILIVLMSFIIGGLICKLIGVKILHSIGLAFVAPVLLVFVLHTFDVENGILVPHVGDFFVAVVIVIAILYWIFLILYTAVYEVIKTKCCNTSEVILTKIKESYGQEEVEPLFSKKDVDKVILSIDETPVKDVDKVILSIDETPVKDVDKVILSVGETPVKDVDKVILSMDQESPSLPDPSPSPLDPSLSSNLPSTSSPIPISKPIDIAIFSQSVDHRNMSGSLK